MPDSPGSRQHPELMPEQSGLPTEIFAVQEPSAAICILDSDGRYLWANQELAALHGIAAADHIGRTVADVLGPLAEQIDPHLGKVLDNGQPILNVQLVSKHPKRESNLHWRMHFFPIGSAIGKPAKVGVIVTELTKEKTLERAVHDLNGKLRKETRRLHALTEINGLLSSNRDLPAMFGSISAQIRRVLYHEFASLFFYDAETNHVVTHALDFPLGKGLLEVGPIPLQSSPLEEALAQAKPRIFSKTELEGFENKLTNSLLAEGLQSLSCLPMLGPKGPLGALILGSTRRNAFLTEDLGLLAQVANQLALAMENHLAATEIRVLKQRLGEERKFLEGEIEYKGHFTEIVGNSPALRQVLQQVSTVATSAANVLILGETGTGKELVARAIHRLSRRKELPFVKLNCAAIPTGLLESELFGHEKGAFTGAINQKIGRLELADGGTLFLDEVGEIPLELQPKLLRVLQDQEFERLGSNRTVKVNVRIVAATNRNLAERIAQNQFRSDLFYRLSVFPIVLPSLRERRDDIPILVRYFVRQFCLRMDRHIESIPTATMQTLQQWDWPGNVRELENLMERSIILSAGTVLEVPLSELSAPKQLRGLDRTHETLDEAERQHILRVLRQTKGKLSGRDGAAQRLGLKRTTLQAKMKRLNITRSDYSDPQSS